MKDQLKKLYCLLFGHHADLDCELNNIQHCLRCGDYRDNPYYSSEYWTVWECYGLIIYPLKKVKWFIVNLWYKVKMKIKYLFTRKDDKDELPF